MTEKQLLLTGNEFKVLKFLESLDNKTISTPKIADRTNLTRNSINRLLRQLHGFYCIEIEGEGTETRTYKINPEEIWTI